MYVTRAVELGVSSDFFILTPVQIAQLMYEWIME